MPAHDPTRNGKIARLPSKVRDEVCQRLFLERPAPEILRWLNALPEVRERLAAYFRGAEITAANLKQWEKGGYAHWCATLPESIHAQKRRLLAAGKLTRPTLFGDDEG